MITYTLILTLAIRYSAPAVAIQTIPEFTTVEECQAAGNAWLEQQNRRLDVFYSIRASALCVRKEVK